MAVSSFRGFCSLLVFSNRIALSESSSIRQVLWVLRELINPFIKCKSSPTDGICSFFFLVLMSDCMNDVLC